MERENDEEYLDTSSEVGKLILELKHLEKRPILDNSLGEVLQSFIQSLNRSEDYLQNGILNINFAEAALLLQSSASIYSKKVDLLWDMINQCQKRLVSLKDNENNENRNELERIEERERKYKRRKNIEVEIKKISKPHEPKSFLVDWQEIKDSQHLTFEKDSKLYSEWHKKMICKWDSQPAQRSNKSLAYKQVQFRSPENAICDKDQEDEFVVYTSKMESAIGLEDLIVCDKQNCDFSFELYSKLYLVPKFLQEKGLNFKDLEDNSVEFEKFVGHFRDRQLSDNCMHNEEYSNDLIIDKDRPPKLRRESVSSPVNSRLDLDFGDIYVNECQVNVLRLSVDDLSRLSRLSVDEVKKYWSEGEEHFHKENFEKEVAQPESFSSDYEDHSDICDRSSPLNLPIDEIPRRITVKDVKKKNTDSVVFERVDYKTKSFEIVRKKPLETNKNDEIPEKRRKLSKKSLSKLVVGITVDLDEFDSFYCGNYQAEENERFQTDITLDDPLDSSSRIGQEDTNLLSELRDTPILCTQDSGYESNFQYNEDSSVNDTQPSDFEDVNATISESNRVPEEPTTEQQSTDETHLTGDDKPLYQRVYEWKQHMTEKFKTLKSADFNIHEYGSSIMENFEEGKPRKFSSIVKGKSAADVTRFFISALQLANTNNVEIAGAQSGKLSNESFELKLISKDRYYDRLKDYMAPSEQDYQRRLCDVENLRKRRGDFKPGGSSSKRNRF